MTTNTVLTTMLCDQFYIVNGILQYLIADMSEAEWCTRIADNENKIGFLAWHVPAAQDFVVQTLIRGVPEVRFRPEWRSATSLDTTTLSFGISLQEADQTAYNSSPEQVLAYAKAVRKEIVAWLRSDDGIPFLENADGHTNIQKAAFYQDTAFSDELDLVVEAPIWRLLSNTCCAHLRTHLGEIEAVKRQLRQQHPQQVG